MSIVDNKKAYHDYFIEEKFEAGVALLGWEVKAIRAGRAQIKEAYVIVSKGELVLIGSHISPLLAASTHVLPDPTRTRKLLLHGAEIETYDDHRMAMSMALIGLKVPGIVIKNPACVAKTYPRFFEDLEALRT